MRSVNAIATEATVIEQAWDAEKGRPYEERQQIEEISAAAAMAVRESFWGDDGIAEDAHETVDISQGFGARAATRILAVLGQMPDEPTAVAAFARASRTLVDWWDSGNGRAREQRRDRDYHTESAVSKRLQDFLMRVTAASALEVLKPVLDAIGRHPREVDSIIDGLTTIEDSRPNTPQYWFLWRLFAEAVKQAKWISRLDGEHPVGGEILSAIFLSRGWKDNVRHWRSLEGYAHHVHRLFEALPPSSKVLDDYARFLYHIGERSLPEAFVRIANALRLGDPQKMLRQTNTVFLLEVLLQRHVYGRPLELKRDHEVRQAVLSLLDFLVETGSSAAFRMRDDFVTPISVA